MQYIYYGSMAPRIKPIHVQPTLRTEPDAKKNRSSSAKRRQMKTIDHESRNIQINAYDQEEEFK